MCANPYRGEVALKVDGKTRKFKMTLGAIAMLEDRLKTKSSREIFERFAQAKYTADDLINVLECAYYGANNDYLDIADCVIEGGAKAAAETAMELIKKGLIGDDRRN